MLPLISKIIKNFIHDQTSTFLNSNNLLNTYQPGFRKKHCTDFCLSYLNDKSLKSFDKGLMTGMILIDFQMAFDTIDHDILLLKLYAIDFLNYIVNWFQSSFSNRSSLVNFANSFSQPVSVSCSVPQGCILGTLLFLVNVNDMYQAVKCDIFLYADDRCLVFQHKYINKIENQLHEDFYNICDWFVDNNLSIHFGENKTKSILFASKSKRKNI